MNNIIKILISFQNLKKKKEKVNFVFEDDDEETVINN